jgi:hypothetical protein
MPEILTLEEMRRRYDGEWVMIAYTKIDPETNEVGSICGSGRY